MKWTLRKPWYWDVVQTVATSETKAEAKQPKPDAPATAVEKLSRYARRSPDPEVDRSRSEPFVGWKAMSVQIENGTILLRGMFGSYGVDATATCDYDHSLGHGGPAPVWNCTCGFYALAEKLSTPEYGVFLAEVELFGRVIEAEHGWRASRQRVLSLRANRQCHMRGPLPVFIEGLGAMVPECTREACGFNVMYACQLMPICAYHAPFGVMTVADLQAALGTEVRWNE
jgi:hypothetical protein